MSKANMSYDDCMKENMDKVLHEFKTGKLKLQNGKIVNDRKQAIAIAISMSMKKCIMTKKDIIKIEKKIMMFLLADIRKISEKRIPLTDVIETRMLIKNYIKMKDLKRAHKLERLLFNRITQAALGGIKVERNIWEELHNIHNML